MATGNGHGKIDPKWDSLIDQWTREVLTTMGRKLGSLNLGEQDKGVAQVAMARALIYAGCSIVYDHTGNHGESAEEIIQEITKAFCAEM